MKKGLTQKKADELLIEFGKNTIVDHHNSTILQKFVEQFKNFLVILLIIAATLSFFIGEIFDGSLILTIVLLNAFFGVYQENKAEEAVAALKELSVSVIRVIRDGHERELDSTLLVPGDIVFIEEGVKLPADGKLIDAISLEMNESALTGESIALPKVHGDEVFMGTIVSKGRGYIEILHTGMQTKFGQIADKLQSVDETLTPLQKKLAHVTELIGIVGIISSFVVFGLSVMQGGAYFPSFLLAISLAVAVVPESLPAVMTAILSIGVKRMASKNAIVRRLASIEALGSITLIATDKTGTLTENKMDVKELWMSGKIISLEDAKKKIHDDRWLEKLVLDGILCSSASLVSVHDHERTFDTLGDPTEGALLVLGKTLGYEPDILREAWKSIGEVPFDSVTKRMTVMVEKDTETAIFTKGAPESILAVSSHIIENGKKVLLTDALREKLHVSLEVWTHQGLRVLAFSYFDGKKAGDIHSKEQIFLGTVAIHDPPRPEAKLAIEKARAAGIRVVMITGDNEKTAEAIGTAVGLVKHGDLIIKGEQIDTYSDEELIALLPHVRIFARTSPFHKSRIVALYQHVGEIVAVTGDGVNDAIALKQADVGVAMGRQGTDVARETADMVIADDNFATIVSAIEEGRNIVKRINSSIKYLLTGNLAEALALIGGLVIGFPPIFLPIQLLYINLISDGVPALAMAFIPQNENVMRAAPSKKLSLLSKQDYHYIATIGFIVGFVVIGVFYFQAGDVATKRTAAFTVMAMVQAFIFVDIWLSHVAKNHRLQSMMKNIFVITLLSPILLQLILVRIEPLSIIFHITPMSYSSYLFYVLVAASSLGIIAFLRKLHNIVKG